MLPLELLSKTKSLPLSDVARTLFDVASKTAISGRMTIRSDGTWACDDWTHERPLKLGEEANWENNIWRCDDWSQERLTRDTWHHDSMWCDNWSDNWVERQRTYVRQQSDRLLTERNMATKYCGRWEDWQ